MSTPDRPVNSPDVAPSLRDAGPGDRAFLLALYGATRRAELSHVAWDETVRELFLRMQFEAQASDYARRHPASRCQVIELHGCPIGRLWLARSETALHVLDIALLPALQGRGIGGGCLQRVIDGAAALRLPVELHVAIGSPARRLYERLGFRPVGDAAVHQAMRWSPPIVPRRATTPTPSTSTREGGIEDLEAPHEQA